MGSTALQQPAPRVMRVGTLELPSERTLVLLALLAIGVLAAMLRLANLAALGYANHYYTAAVASMLQSWHNFFFAAAEPGASVTVDKPPVGLWIQAISAFFLGVNNLGVLLPEIVCGVLSVFVVYHLVQRTFGQAAGLLAGLALAITPVAVATDRNNTIDSILIFVLLLAAWAFIKATESGRLRFLLVGAALVGIGFNIKMLQAFLPLPAFYALYFLGGKERLLRKVGRLVLASVLLLVISLSWATIVDLVPADQRPYVGSSSDNSELSLIVGYNGMQRLMGMGFAQGNSTVASTFSSIVTRLLSGGRSTTTGDGGGRGFTDGGGMARFPGGGMAGGGFNTGQTGMLRLFQAPLSKETSWLLPFALIGGLLAILRSRLRWPISAKHQAVVLWGGWLFIGGVFFSVAGFFHPYYLCMLAPPAAALVGIAAAEIWGLRQSRWWLALIVLLVAVAGTLVVQMQTAQAYVAAAWWLPMVIGVVVIGIALLAVAGRNATALARAGFVCVVAALLVTPAIWSALTVRYSSSNQSLPAAYEGQTSGPANRGAVQVNQTLLDYLQANTVGMKYLLAVPSSMQGADYVLATGRPVLYLGGFSGNDPVASGTDLAELVAAGELRYIYWDARNAGRGGFGGQADAGVSAWVTKSCTLVRGYDTATQNAGAPDGTTAGDGFAWSGGGMQVTLYDCAGAAG